MGSQPRRCLDKVAMKAQEAHGVYDLPTGQEKVGTILQGEEN